jgi:adenylate kinase
LTDTDSITIQTAPAEQAFLPGPILLLGAPGVGKGTQAQILMAEYGIPQISTGDLLRSNIAGGTDLGLKAKATIDSGLLVADEIVQNMVAARLLLPDVAQGFILDGFPRTLGQAMWLDGLLSSKPETVPVIAISIEVDEEDLRHRITGRRTCAACKSIYNIYFNPPAAEGLCDLDGTQLVQRPDDTEAVFTERMKTFELQTAPVIEHYRQLGRFATVDGGRSVEAVTADLEAALVDLRARTGAM